MTTKILIADPHPFMRKGIREFLIKTDKSYKVVGEASSADELLEQIEKKKCQLLILEPELPGIDKLQFIEDLKKEHPSLKILVLSAFPEKIYAPHCLKVGASAYVSKAAAPKIFKKTLQQVIKADSKFKLKEKKQHSQNSTLDEQIRKLSRREVDVLKLLLKGHRNKDIGSILGLNEKTVSTYKSRLLKKLALENLADLINHINFLAYKDH